MSFNYGKLRDRILEKYKRLSDFAIAMGMSRTTLSLKLNNIATFTAAEISKACVLLDIDVREIPDYFFTPKVQKHEQVEESA